MRINRDQKIADSDGRRSRRRYVMYNIAVTLSASQKSHSRSKLWFLTHSALSGPRVHITKVTTVWGH